MVSFKSKTVLTNGDDSFADRQECVRNSVGIERSDLAGAASVCEKSNRRSWGDDSSEVDQKNISKVAGILGVSSSWLLTGAGEGPDAQSEEAEMVNFMRWELQRLVRMHEETAAMIDTLNRRIADIEQNCKY